MPELAGRRRAALVALLGATIVLSILPLASSSASAPPGIDRFLYALGQVESGGNYYAYNATSGAYGKYQIMPASWRAWARTYLGNAYAPQTPTNQEKVARAKVTALYWWLDTWPNVAHWWLTGSSERNQNLWSSYSKKYVARIMAIYNAVTTAAPPPASPAPATPPPPGFVDVSTQRLAETSRAIVYSSGWASASHTSYAGDAVRYSERDGASATVTFSGRAISWVGPVGPTRGVARITVDGAYVGTVDLRRSDFKARVTLLTRTWASVGQHTIRIQVAGSGRPVAIDEFVITTR